MQLTAMHDFTAHHNGVDYALKKGDKFTGDALAASHFVQLGLLKAAKGKVEKNER